jgi:hypothetical protein
MELSKKTTILFPPDLHDRLSRLAAETGRSLGELVREACETRYGIAPPQQRLDAVDELAALRLPIGEPHELERESVPQPGDPTCS